MIGYLRDAALIAGVTASLFTTAEAFDSLGERTRPLPRMEQPTMPARSTTLDDDTGFGLANDAKTEDCRSGIQSG